MRDPTKTVPTTHTNFKAQNKKSLKNICQKCQHTLTHWPPIPNPDFLRWIISIQWISHRWMKTHWGNVTFYPIKLCFAPTNSMLDFNRLIFPNQKNQPKVSGLNIVNQRITHNWHFWQMFFNLFAWLTRSVVIMIWEAQTFNEHA